MERQQRNADNNVVKHHSMIDIDVELKETKINYETQVFKKVVKPKQAGKVKDKTNEKTKEEELDCDLACDQACDQQENEQNESDEEVEDVTENPGAASANQK